MKNSKQGFIESHLKIIIAIILIVSVLIAGILTIIAGICIEKAIIDTGTDGHFSIYYLFNPEVINMGDGLDFIAYLLIALWYFILLTMFAGVTAYIAIPCLIILLICCAIERKKTNKLNNINIHTMHSYMYNNPANTGNSGENNYFNNTSYNKEDTVNLNKEQ